MYRGREVRKVGVEEMIVDHEELMKWAKDEAPMLRLPISESRGEIGRRPVRLELTTEYEFAGDHVIARVYLREPRCLQLTHDPERTVAHTNCECGPLAERWLA